MHQYDIWQNCCLLWPIGIDCKTKFAYEMDRPEVVRLFGAIRDTVHYAYPSQTIGCPNVGLRIEDYITHVAGLPNSVANEEMWARMDENCYEISPTYTIALPSDVILVISWLSTESLPDNFEQPVSNDKHLSGHFSLPTNQVPWGEDERPHFQHQIMQEFRLTLLENRYLEAFRVLVNFGVFSYI